MLKSQDLKPGTQIIYIPDHADGIDHPSCEEGFVTSVTEKGAFCRYFNKYDPGKLRTMSCSEMTPFGNLVIKNMHLQSEVDWWLHAIEDEYCISIPHAVVYKFEEAIHDVLMENLDSVGDFIFRMLSTPKR